MINEKHNLDFRIQATSLKARDRLELVKMSTSRIAAGDRIGQIPTEAAQEHQAEAVVELP